jgi:hypothetical protein
MLMGLIWRGFAGQPKANLIENHVIEYRVKNAAAEKPRSAS